MTKIVKYPKKIEFTPNVSSRAIFIKGPKDWSDKVAEKIKQSMSDLTIMQSGVKLTEWDTKYLGLSEVALIYLDKTISIEHILLLLVPHQCRFPPITYIKIEDDYSYKELISNLISTDKHLTLVNDFDNVLDKSLKIHLST